MFLIDPDPTPYDLRFRLVGVHVRVHPLFWLVGVLFGWDYYVHPQLPDSNGVADLALWMACWFLSFLIHEMGHVLMGRAFGSDGHIVLYGFGGLAIGSNDLYRRWQRILVSAAGPGAELLLAALLWLAFLSPWAFFPYDPLTPLGLLVWMLIFVSVFWSVLNLLPVWPLDGGQITREVCQGLSPSRGVVVSLWISLGVAATLAVTALLTSRGALPLPPLGFPWGFLVAIALGGGMFRALFMAALAYGSWQALQAETSQRYWDEDRP